MTDLGGKPIFLIGYRGTGKSTVARELAARLGYDWVDADAVIEQRAGKSIAAIFADDGERAFRDLETEVVAELGRQGQIVAALGGGAVLCDANRAVIRAAGPVVWLTASVDTILERIAADQATASRRPQLTAAGGRAEVEALLAARTPLYRECATLVVDTEGKTAAQLVDEIVAKLDTV
jgi:shikimate kinase